MHNYIKQKSKNKNILSFQNEKKLEEEKNLKLLNRTKEILYKESKSRTILEKKALSKYLIKNFDYFKRMANEETKLDKISGVLKVIKFKPNEPIIKYGDNADTFYLVLDGKVGIYRPNYQIKRMTVKQFLEILYNVKNENNILKYNRLIEKNKEFNLDYELLSHINQNSLLFYESFDFFIENDEKIGEFGNGFSFGEMALINNTKRNATIIALNNTECIALDKVDYNHTIREIERERKKSEVKMFKLDYPVFYNWSTMQIMRLFNYFQKISITKGEYLYKQNEMSDSIYMIKKGKFEIFSLISFGWIRDFLSYIINPENNLILELAKFNKTLSEIDLKKLYDKLMNRLQKSPCKYNPYKLNKGSNLNNNDKSFYNLLFKKEEVINDYNLNKIIIKTIENKEVIGLEDSIEIKQRFCCVKCVSESGEVEKVNLYDLFKLLNINNTEFFRNSLYKLVLEKKSILLNQLINSCKNKEQKIQDDINFDFSEYQNRDKINLGDKFHNIEYLATSSDVENYSKNYLNVLKFLDRNNLYNNIKLNKNKHLIKNKFKLLTLKTEENKFNEKHKKSKSMANGYYTNYNSNNNYINTMHNNNSRELENINNFHKHTKTNFYSPSSINVQRINLIKNVKDKIEFNNIFNNNPNSNRIMINLYKKDSINFNKNNHKNSSMFSSTTKISNSLNKFPNFLKNKIFHSSTSSMEKMPILQNENYNSQNNIIKNFSNSYNHKKIFLSPDFNKIFKQKIKYKSINNKII